LLTFQISPVLFSSAQYRTAKAPTVDLMRLNTFLYDSLSRECYTVRLVRAVQDTLVHHLSVQ